MINARLIKRRLDVRTVMVAFELKEHLILLVGYPGNVGTVVDACGKELDY